ncbi:sortase A [Gracilibacillus orientalis]|uniref:Sortase A n=1 Tax=Gracilibacillus orientalis TaxID=334253 RepID=A0A1I4IM97_9BACI|nr:class D sortase [Gracilibacillus orientalis]SFL55187.1 sortase A [Gracilibacillus orientalis]
MFDSETIRKKPNKQQFNSKKWLLVLSTVLMLSGLLVTGANAYHFLQGYLLYKPGNIAEDLGDGDKTKASIQMENKTPIISNEEEIIEQQKEPLYSEQPEQGAHIGELIIPKLDASLPIYHGTDEDELVKGVGHYAGSVLPGEQDNTVLSGHRDTVFRDLGIVGENDLLIVKTTAGRFTYKVNQVRIVDEDDRTVIVPAPTATLTVTTCYPFNFIGSAPERYVLVAEMIKSEI